MVDVMTNASLLQLDMVRAKFLGKMFVKIKI